jgi:hypothetical protein
MADLSKVIRELVVERKQTEQHLERLDAAIAAVRVVTGSTSSGKRSVSQKSVAETVGHKPRRKLSAAARKKISLAQKARWAKAKKTAAAKS